MRKIHGLRFINYNIIICRFALLNTPGCRSRRSGSSPRSIHLQASVAGVVLYGVDDAILALLHDVNVFARTVQTIAGPVEEDNVARLGS